MKHFPNLHTYTDEIEKFFEDLVNKPLVFADKYPATNVYKDAEGKTHIEIAVTGFSEEDLSVELEDDILIVEGKRQEATEDEGKTYSYRGIARRAFTRTFAVKDIKKVIAKLDKGILHLALEQEEATPVRQKIQII